MPKARKAKETKPPKPNTGNLNDLDSKAFIKHKRSWFVMNAQSEPEWNSIKKHHPATYPRGLVAWMLECWTKRGMTVLDPMMGSGSTLVEAARMCRRSYGIDLYAKHIKMAKDALALHRKKGTKGLENWIEGGDEALLEECWNPTMKIGDALKWVSKIPSNSIDYVLFSPPYVNFLHRSSGGVQTRHKQRAAEGLSTVYGENPNDIGNTPDEQSWRGYMVRLAKELFRVTRNGRMMTIVIQNEMRIRLNPIAWRLGLAIDEQTQWEMCPEQIWCQEEKPLTIHGWPSRLIINNHHHYCLNFQKEIEEGTLGGI